MVLVIAYCSFDINFVELHFLENSIMAEVAVGVVREMCRAPNIRYCSKMLGVADEKTGP